MSGLSDRQREVLAKPLNSTRVAKRQQGGKSLSYLESWDVRAHLIRVFGYTNFDVIVTDTQPVGVREYRANDKDMVEVSWLAKVRLNLRDSDGHPLATYVEAAVGSTAGPATMIGEHHDNAIKTAASDALKRCAINLGSQFGLSLYDNGSTRDVVKGTLLDPVKDDEPTPEQLENLQRSLGATKVPEGASTDG